MHKASPMKNVGIFTHDLYPFKPWGQGRYVYDLAKHLRRIIDAKVFIFSPSEGIDDPDHVQIFKNSHRSLGKNTSYSVKVSLIIENLVRRYDLGLAHFQGGPGGLFLLKHPSVPVLYTAHHTYYQQSAYVPGQRWKRVFIHPEKLGYGKADHIVCASPSTRRLLIERYGLKGQKCSVVLLGVDKVQFFDSHSDRIPESLLFIGRLEARKGIDFLLKAIPLVKTRCPDVRFFLAGEGILRPLIEKTVREQGLERNVILLGALQDGQVSRWYNRVTAVVVPSVFEGFGLNAAEAMACGTPVIATNVDGLRDVVDNGVNGCLVEYGNVERMAETISFVLRNDRERRKLAENGLLKAINVFDWDKAARQTAVVYNTLL
jgi:glycosyltransferase involved in cell wall biosynthesis